MARVLTLICGTMFFLGCGNVIDKNALSGIYVAEYPYGTEELVLNADGTYQQLFAYTGQALQTINTGQWEVRDLEGQKVVLYDPVIVDDGFGRPTAMKKENAIRPLRIKKWPFGTLRFPVNEDLGIEFRKIS